MLKYIVILLVTLLSLSANADNFDISCKGNYYAGFLDLPNSFAGNDLLTLNVRIRDNGLGFIDDFAPYITNTDKILSAYIFIGNKKFVYVIDRQEATLQVIGPDYRQVYFAGLCIKLTKQF